MFYIVIITLFIIITHAKTDMKMKVLSSEMSITRGTEVLATVK